MEIVVCMKQVPDTETKVQLVPGQKAISEEGVSFIINPYCEFAVEEALRIKEAGDATVTVVSLGPARTEEAIRSALAMGADKAVHIQDTGLEKADALTVARVLAAAVKQLPHDLVLCGMKAVDDDGAFVGPALAELLDLPQATVVTKLEITDNRLKVEREVEGGTEVLDLPLPALITAQKGLNEPRYPSFAGIMKAKKKPVEKTDAATLGAAVEPVIESVDLFMPPPRTAGKPLAGDAAAAVAELVRQLHEEAKVV